MADGVDHTHGDTGTKPSDSLNFQDGDYPDPEVFDWFWTEVPAAINDHKNLLEAIDSDEDGVVDRANELALGSVGDGLKGGESSALAVEPADLAGSGLQDDGSDNFAIVDEYVEDLVNTLVAAGDKLSWTYDDAGNTLTIDTTALDHEEVEDAVNGLLSGGNAISLTYDDAGNTLTIDVSESSINHNNLTNAEQSDAHHARYADSEAVAAVEAAALAAITLADSDGDGSTFSITEDDTTGNLEVRHGGAARHELAQNGDVRIEGSLTENASL